MSINPLSLSGPWTLVAEGYQAGTVPAFRQYCQKAIDLVGYKPGGKVIDVACGPGTLSLMLADSAAEIAAIDFSEGMLEIFRRLAAEQKQEKISIWQMDGQKLEFADAAFDYAFSMFGLMFFPDRMAGFTELFRVLKPGGQVAVSSWAPVAESPMMSLMFGSLRAAFPERPEPKTNLLSLENPEFFKEEMQKAGFQNVQITAFDGEWRIENAEKFLDSMVRGSAPLEMMRKNLPDGVWVEKRKLIQAHLEKQLPVLPATLHSRAFIGTGTK
jgi:ubiquinone/menaquinone biosynthesis C-methylase UbiE